MNHWPYYRQARRSDIGAESPGKAIVCNRKYWTSASISRSLNAEETVVVKGKRGKKKQSNSLHFCSMFIDVKIFPCHLMVEYFSKYGRYENFTCPEELLMGWV